MSKAETETLWQIGKPGGSNQEFIQEGGWQAEFTYTVGSDEDPINQPSLPPVLVVAGLPEKPKRGKKQLYCTDKLNIGFTLDHGYGENQLTLFYAFRGLETDHLLIDGEALAEIQGIGQRKLKKSQISLPALTSGKHTLTLTTSGGDGDHWIDYLKLESVVTANQTGEEKMPSKSQSKKTKSSAPEEKVKAHVPSAGPSTSGATGLEDYGYWLKTVAKMQAEKGEKDKKPFRRGRIWT
ncbi:MAG: cyanobactin biosynthesis PatC/TenC/TruC family protein [Moorea sp. SIO1G6]|uniref:cyanobactin biosynthesis PatC/TenC/TruC family protein n=1 Tax=Moorena sp. SIO1G6 TaxID=2607840 RepID=UPI0013C0E886|nr:cyanobactin biosynthesis PatC/TenC/TruC family protein [Moorena sp. SIO1G6]NET65389.1 cyanobactin biosynthesis PatC/TenC/TruC family protein [Moorena sp. SIO1G6]